MLGAIIGDLAAWTWENDHGKFYPDLVLDNSQLSIYGCAMLNAARKVLQPSSRNDSTLIGSPTDGHKYLGQKLMADVVDAWIRDKAYSSWHKFVNDSVPHSMSDDERYAQLFVEEIIFYLRKGYTKSETCKKIPSFDAFYVAYKENSHEKDDDDDSILAYIFKAWDCFNKGFDFTSSIHNAVKCVGDRSLIAVLTGAFASAMYGNEYIFLKKKYVTNGDNAKIVFDKVQQIIEKNGYDYNLVQAIVRIANEKRSFFPKNNARTNVEKHHFKKVVNPLGRVIFSEEDKNKILKAFYTDWDNRYGFYLDDGWIYCYRSFYLLGRFQLNKVSEGWSLVNTELSGEKNYCDVLNAISQALYSCKVQPILHFEDIGNAEALSFCLKYFNGIEDASITFEGSAKDKFSYGEMRFVKSYQVVSKWAEEAKEIRQELKGDELLFAEKLNDNQLGIVLYLEALYGKWYPYNDLNWIFQY